MNGQDTTKTTSVNTPLKSKVNKKLSDTSTSSPVIVPTPSVTSDPDDLALRDTLSMESSHEKTEDQVADESSTTQEQPAPVVAPAEGPKVTVVAAKKTDKKSKRLTKKAKRKAEESSSSDSSDSDSDSESDDSTEDERTKRKIKKKLAAKRAAKKKQKAKAKSKKKSKKYDSTSDESSSGDSSDSESESEEETKKSRRKALRAKAKKRKSKRVQSSSDESSSDSSSSSSSSDSDSEDEKSKRKRSKAKAKRKTRKSRKSDSSSSDTDSSSAEFAPPVPPADLAVDAPLAAEQLDSQVKQVSVILKDLRLKQSAAHAVAGTSKLDKPVKRNVLEFKRVDQVYDMKLRDWKLVESNNVQKDEFDCVFTVRRRLDWEGKYKETQVDIKSKLLRNALQEIFKECKSISLVEDTPQVDPHTLFHYYSEIKSYIKKTLKPKLKKAKKSKDKKSLTSQIAQCKLLLSYIDEDYESVRKALKPMLKAGTITYDLVWALFKPNTIAFTPTYTNKDDPRCFKVDFSYEYESWMTGLKSLVVDGKYLEYDGKAFGLGDHQVMIQAFKGHKKITSLAAYPLKFHKDSEVSSNSLFSHGP